MRSNGILMHLSSLPSPHGIGSMGKPARDFADFLQAAGQSYWQLLPVCPTGYGDSPYQSFSTNAGSPYFIDLDELKEEGLLEASDYEYIDWESDPDDVNYGVLYEKRYPVLKKAVKKFLENPAKDYPKFCEKNAFWLDDYALFMAEKYEHEGKSYTLWEDDIRLRKPEALKKMQLEDL